MNQNPNVVFEALSAGRGTWQTIGDTEYYVAPIVAMVQGVVHAMNARRPEFVPADQLSIEGWDGRPVFINHPMVNGEPVASFHPEVHGTHIGYTRNPSVADQKLMMEVCIEKMKMSPELLAHIDSDEPFNVSMGAFVNSVKKEGVYGGKPYFSEWHDIDPDHMALLPATKGACSWEMGCGVRAAGELRAAWMNKDGEDNHGRVTDAHAKAASEHEGARAVHEAAAAMHREAANSSSQIKSSAAHSATEKGLKLSAKAFTASSMTGKHNSEAVSAHMHANEAAMHAKNGDHVLAARSHASAAERHGDAQHYHKYQANYQRRSYEEAPVEKVVDPKMASIFARAMSAVKKVLAENSITMSDEELEQLEEPIVEEPVAEVATAEARPDTPCGCKGKTTDVSVHSEKETDMEKKDRVKALIAASNGMFSDADQTMLEGAPDENLARYEAAVQAQNKTLTDAAAAVTAASAKPEAATFEQLLAAAPAGVRDAVNSQVKAAADKRDATIKILTDSGRCNFTKEQLANFDQPSLDNLVTLAAIKPVVDHSLVLPPAGGPEAPFVAAQTNETFNEKVAKARGKK